MTENNILGVPKVGDLFYCDETPLRGDTSVLNNKIIILMRYLFKTKYKHEECGGGGIRYKQVLYKLNFAFLQDRTIDLLDKRLLI